jgi:hypothetical protein
MLGEWCTADAINTKAQEVYFRPNHRESDRSHCSDFTEGIEMDKDGYGHEGLDDSVLSCVFDKVEQIDKETYLVHTHCETHDGNGNHVKEDDFIGQ